MPMYDDHSFQRDVQADSDRLQASWVHQPTSVIQWFAAMVAFMQPAQVERFLVHILSPVYRIVEDDTIRGPEMGMSILHD